MTGPTSTPLPTGTITFLLTDIEKSTALWEAHGEDMATAVERHEGIIASATKRHGGVLIRSKGEGDSCFCVFPLAADALAAALAAQLELNSEQWRGLRPAVRMGIHTGPAELREGQYYGTVVNRCARLRGIAHGGQTLLSEAAAQLAGRSIPSGASLKDMGAHRLEGLAQPERVFQLCHASLPDVFPALASLDARPNNLPIHLTRFVDREHEVTELNRLLVDHRLVTFTGPGGCGKTRLAVQAATALVGTFADGVWLVRLAPIEDPALVSVQVASSLGIREQPGEELVDTLVDHLRPRTSLLILDNCEHLIEEAADTAALLLTRCPHLAVIATSRQALGIEGEVAVHVRPLSVPSSGKALSVEEVLNFDGVQLLADRAILARHDFAVTEHNAEAVAQICRQLDGIPLAIELAAARLGSLGPTELAHRLDDRFRLLARRRGPERHQTLDAAIDWSYELLSDPERLLFRRLAVFAGRFTLEAAEAICSDESLQQMEVAGLLAALVDRSLLYADTPDAAVTGYRILSTIRSFALTRLAWGGEEESVRSRHLRWYVRLVARAEAELVGADQMSWLERLEAEHDNIRAALTWAMDADPEAAVRLAADFAHFCDIRGYTTEARRWLDQAIASVRGRTVHLARALSWAGNLAHEHGDEGNARPLLERALSLHREFGDRSGEALTLTRLVLALYALGDEAEAMKCFEAGLGLIDELGPERRAVGILVNLAQTAQARGDTATARDLFSKALGLSREVGHLRGIGGALVGLGAIAYAEGDEASAQSLFEESLTLFRDVGDKASVAGTLSNLGVIARSNGDHERATAMLEQALDGYRDLDRKRDIAITLARLGTSAWLAGNLDIARAIHQEALELYRKMLDARGAAASLMSLGRIARAVDDFAGAFELIREAIIGLRDSPRSRILATCLEEFAGLILNADTERAVRLFGAAEVLRGELGATGARTGQAIYERDVASAREQLGSDRFDMLWAEGREMTSEEAAQSTSLALVEL
jgi:predicted ATPase/class 3 adenylate cyclase